MHTNLHIDLSQNENQSQKNLAANSKSGIILNDNTSAASVNHEAAGGKSTKVSM